MSLGTTLNANFLTGSLRGVERQHKGLFHNGIYTREKIKKSSPKVGLGVTTALYANGRINRTNKQGTTANKI